MRTAIHKPHAAHTPAAIHTAQRIPAAQFADNRPEALQMKERQAMVNSYATQQTSPVQMIANSQAPVQRMKIDMLYLNQFGSLDLFHVIDSYHYTAEALEKLKENHGLSQHSIREIDEAIEAKETKDNPSGNVQIQNNQVPGAVYDRYARKSVNPYGVKEDEVVGTLKPEFADTEVGTQGGSLYFKNTKTKVSGNLLKYGIRHNGATLHIVAPGGQIRHSSTVKGESVLSAGDITVNGGGIVTYIDNNSGHYAPEPDFFINGMRHLYHNGFISPGKVRFGVHHSGQLHKLNTIESAKLLFDTATLQKPVPQQPTSEVQVLD